MDPPQDFKSLQDTIQKSLVSTAKTVNRIAAEDLSFQRTVNSDVADQLDDKTSRLLDLSNRLLQASVKACGGKLKAPKLEDVEDVDVQWRGIVDVVDTVLEKADTALDEYTGLVKRKGPPEPESGPSAKRPKSTNRVIRNAHIPKPQLKFELQPDNIPSAPWKPLITKKPHATVPLEKTFVTFTSQNGQPQYRNPYEQEISNMQYPQHIYKSEEPIMYQPVESTQATWVDTYEGVLEMLEELKGAKEIAVDLEHHDFRTYIGLVCLMQISTRDKDWIVDTLQPWRHKLEVLNEVFADPKIVKVFHGAYMDMIWLQRDLGLYVNGLFDTFFACELLYSGKSLAFLLSRFVNFDADKQYQLADWRMRPLPEEMMYYARSDTHFLLYIYDNVRNDLIAATARPDSDKDYLGRVLERSQELSLSRHEHPYFNEKNGDGPRGWYGYVLKHAHLSFDAEQFAVFRALWKWRDDTARKEDESTVFIMGNQPLIDIARVNPPDAKALHSMLPLTAPLARSRVNEIWSQIQATKAENGPSLLRFFTLQAPDALGHNRYSRARAPRAAMPELDGEISIRTLPQSQLFGKMPISTRWEQSADDGGEKESHVPFPWHRFVQNATTDEDAAENGMDKDEDQTEEPSEQARAAAQPEAEDDSEFTLKKGRKRKSAALDAEEEEEDSSPEASEDEQSEDNGGVKVDEALPDADDVLALDGDDPKKTSKKERKAARKAQQQQQELERIAAREARAERKAAKREAKMKQAEEEEQKKGATYNAVPFDYSKASSVMNGAKKKDEGESKDGGKGGKRAKKVFDPYSKTGDDAMKGARKAPPVRGERSATFKK